MKRFSRFGTFGFLALAIASFVFIGSASAAPEESALQKASAGLVARLTLKATDGQASSLTANSMKGTDIDATKKCWGGADSVTAANGDVETIAAVKCTVAIKGASGNTKAKGASILDSFFDASTGDTTVNETVLGKEEFQVMKHGVVDAYRGNRHLRYTPYRHAWAFDHNSGGETNYDGGMTVEDSLVLRHDYASSEGVVHSISGDRTVVTERWAVKFSRDGEGGM